MARLTEEVQAAGVSLPAGREGRRRRGEGLSAIHSEATHTFGLRRRPSVWHLRPQLRCCLPLCFFGVASSRFYNSFFSHLFLIYFPLFISGTQKT